MFLEHGDWSYKERKSEDHLEADKEQYFASSHAYDPRSGVFVGDWKVDLSCARIYRRRTSPAGAASSASMHALHWICFVLHQNNLDKVTDEIIEHQNS